MKSQPHPYILTGMVRSGSTLSSRLLDAHPAIHCSSDPFLAFFRFFRNDLLNKHGLTIDEPGKPFSDYFLRDNDELELLLQADFDLAITSSWNDILPVLQHLAKSNDPRVIPLLPNKAPATYRELFDQLMDILRELATEPDGAIGFKQAWTEAFTPAILNTYPEFRALHLLRDPRAVLASWFRSTDLRHDYPFLMLLRHWRKSAFLAHRLSEHYSDRYCTYRYEDLVGEPDATLKRICRHLGLELDPAMLDADNLKKPTGENWSGNTSYGTKTDGSISTSFINKWSERLEADQVELIEILCGPTLDLWDYPRVSKADPNRLPEIWKGPQREVAAETEWIAPYVHSYSFTPENLELEQQIADLASKTHRTLEEEKCWDRFALRPRS